MRLKAILIPFLAFVLAGFGATAIARWAVGTVERQSVLSVQEALIDDGHIWARVIGDGLQIVIEGDAPDEAARFRAKSAAASVVDSSRVIDNIAITEGADTAPPAFSLTVLRNDTGVSLAGLIPQATDRVALMDRVAGIAGTGSVSDLLSTADYPVPDGWDRSLDFALDALSDLPTSQIEVAPGTVEIAALATSAEDIAGLEDLILASAPVDIAVSLDLTAPRPVIAPFVIRATADTGGLRLETCTSGSDDGAARIVAAAMDAGASGAQGCNIGLGRPSDLWPDAAVAVLGALGQMGDGQITMSNLDITFVGGETVGQTQFDAVTAALAEALPPAFALDTTLRRPAGEDPETDAPARFTATRSPEGEVQLRGAVGDALMAMTVENFARARFDPEALTVRLGLSESLPTGWSVEVLAAVEALSMLRRGIAEVTPETLLIRGETGDPEARDRISRLLVEKLGAAADFTVEVTYVEALAVETQPPSAEECVAQITALNEARKITFDPGSSDLTDATLPVVDEIADVLTRCGPIRLEIAGYTDSQGREEMNRDLSQSRAEAVLIALADRGVSVVTFVAVGYGESDPIADNGTEAGREANRRIEFRLRVTEPVDDETTTLESLEEDLPPDGEAAADE